MIDSSTVGESHDVAVDKTTHAQLCRKEDLVCSRDMVCGKVTSRGFVLSQVVGCGCVVYLETHGILRTEGLGLKPKPLPSIVA